MKRIKMIQPLLIFVKGCAKLIERDNISEVYVRKQNSKCTVILKCGEEIYNISGFVTLEEANDHVMEIHTLLEKGATLIPQI